MTRGRPRKENFSIEPTITSPVAGTPIVDKIVKESNQEGNIKVEEIVNEEYTLNVVKDYDHKIDPFYLSEKDPNFEYRFLRDDRKNINIKTSNMLFDRGGWQICPKNHLLRIGIREDLLSPDGLCRRGDTILAFMPKDLFLEKENDKIERANATMTAVKRRVEGGESDNSELIGLGHPNMKGLQTDKQLNMK